MRILAELREEIFRGGFIPQAFHASEDRQTVRDRVFAAIEAWGDFKVYMTVLEKSGTPPSHRELAAFYTFASDLALRSTLTNYPSDDPVFVITDTLPLRGKREAIVKGLQSSLAASLGHRSFQIEHHASGAQSCLQVLDYVNWAVFRKWERGDDRSYNTVSRFIAQENTLDWTLVR